MKETCGEQEKKDLYVTPEIKSEEVEMGAYASVGDGEVLVDMPSFGACCS